MATNLLLVIPLDSYEHVLVMFVDGGELSCRPKETRKVADVALGPRLPCLCLDASSAGALHSAQKRSQTL